MHIFYMKILYHIVVWAGSARPGRVAPIDEYIIYIHILTLWSYIYIHILTPIFMYIYPYINPYIHVYISIY